MTKRIGYVLGIVLAALIQARLLPELGLDLGTQLLHSVGLGANNHGHHY